MRKPLNHFPKKSVKLKTVLDDTMKTLIFLFRYPVVGR